jgi:hypothetical protein
MTKKWYDSRTLKVNAVLILGLVAQVLTGTPLFDPEIQAGIVAVINIVLRVITKTELK